MEHIKFPKIERVDRARIVITQKLDGTNAQIYIEYTCECFDHHCPFAVVKAGSRNRWLTPEDDNHGFAAWVEENREDLIKLLGPGRHYGEWCGPGIQRGEGLKEKTFVSFNPRHCGTAYEALNIKTVPVLYQGRYTESLLPSIKAFLEATGSCLVPGYMRVEGIVINIAGKLFKDVYEAEDQPRKDKPAKVKAAVNIEHLLQPIRLSKLLGRDEKYLREYPGSLKQLVSDYVADLEEENQFSEVESEKRAQKKALSRHVFQFIKSEITKLSQRDICRSPITPDNAGG